MTSPEEVMALLKKLRLGTKIIGGNLIILLLAVVMTVGGWKSLPAVSGLFAVGILLAWFQARSITKPLHRLIEDLREGSEQVASAAGMVSSASQSLAQGASQQAASLEETSASLEELAATVKQNSQNAEECNRLVLVTNEKTKEVHRSIRATKGIMETIAQSGEQIKKIIKNIDEIAFQTNLLALNAAVEAARAGQSGAGFAVVADEVRNLAQRAAEAAKTTDTLIGETAHHIEQGAAQIQETLTKFYDMGDSAKEVNRMVGEIAVASKEQAQGIAQINQATNEIDRVVQGNAANAEESASAAEQLTAQSEQMKAIVEQLAAMVSGNGQVYMGKKKRGLKSTAGTLKDQKDMTLEEPLDQTPKLLAQP